LFDLFSIHNFTPWAGLFSSFFSYLQLAGANQQIVDLQRVAQQSHERFTELELNARLTADSQQQLQQQMGPQQIARMSATALLHFAIPDVLAALY
jgi:hypothetical protein